MIALEPNLPITYLQLGTALTSLKNYRESSAGAAEGRGNAPRSDRSAIPVGLGVVRNGDFAGATEQFETAVARSPNWPEAHLSLATAYARADRLTDAIPEYEKVIELRPNHYSAHLLLGRAQTLSGNPQHSPCPTF